MQDIETQELILSFIKHAQTAKPSEFHIIRNWSDYRFCKGKQTSFKLLVRSLLKTSARLFKKYCAGVAYGMSDLNKLLVYRQLQQVILFYQRELNTYTSMICEYEAYLIDGNLLAAFLGELRADSDMHDFRE